MYDNAYKVSWRDTLIGMLTVRNSLCYYAPNPGGAAAVKSRAGLLPVMIAGTAGFGPPIPFLPTG